MNKKTKKFLIVGGLLAIVLAAVYYAWYYNTTLPVYPYTDENGITYYADGSYSYINGANIVTQHPDGLTTVTGNPDWVSENTPTPGVLPDYNLPIMTGAGINTGIGIAYGG